MSTLAAPSRTATLPSTSNHASTGHNGSYDLKACLEILRKLAPKVAPDLPSLPPASSTSTTDNNVTPLDGHKSRTKRSSDEGADSDRTVKRSKQSSSGGARHSSSSEEEDQKQRSSLSKSTKGHNDRPPLPKKDTPVIHKRSGSTSSVISLSELKARNNASSNKSKKNRADDEEGNASSSSISAFASRKPIPSSSSAKQTHPSSLSISTNHHQQPSLTSISPTLPSPALTVSSMKESRNTPQSHQNGFSTSGNNALSPDASTSTAILATSTTSAGGMQNVWTRERFKKIAAICREKGRSLKHSGDKKMREYSSGVSPSSSSTSTNNNNNRHLIPIIALFEQIDAVILYAYAFWCEDQAAGQLRNRQAASSSSSTNTSASALSASTNSDHSNNLGASTSSTISVNATQGSNGETLGVSSAATNIGTGAGVGVGAASATFSNSWKAGCITENWKSIFGLVSFVRGRAEKLGSTPLNSQKVGNKIVEGLPRAMEIVVAWMNMLEALILQHLTTNASRNLNTQASKILNSTSPASATTNTNIGSTNDLSPPGGDNESIISSSSTNNTTSSPETSDFLQKFLKLQSDLEKIHSLWPSSQNILLHPELSNLPSISSSSSSTSTLWNNGNLRDRSSGKKDEEDLLNLVLRKGRMAYDYEPTRLDDNVVPDLPRDSEDNDDILAVAANDDNNNDEGDMDADGEPDTSSSLPNNSSSVHNAVNKKRTTTTLSSSSAHTTHSISAGPKSPEDLFKDEENYYRFSWPIVIHHPNSIAHTTSFGRALLFEMSNRLGIGYTSPSLL